MLADLLNRLARHDLLHPTMDLCVGGHQLLQKSTTSLSSCRRAQPACRARCADPRMHGRGVVAEDGAAGAAEASGRDRTRIPTPDSSSRWWIWAFGWKYGPLARICSGSLDRLVLGHLCTDRPENTCNRIARARGCTIGPRGGAAEHGVHTWGTADKQRQVSHTRAARAPAT